MTAAACSGGGSNGGSAAGASPTGSAINGGTVSVALPPSVTPNWIFPLASLANFSVYNISYLQQPMYRPLYWFGGHNDQPTVDYGLSAAQPPKYSDGGRKVTIKLKPWRWSNGEPVDADDVVFWMNMLKAEKANWGAYVPGGFPDNVTKVTKDSANQVTFTLDKKYSSTWYTYNELSQITPMPMAWDVTSMGAKAGSGGCTKSQSRCKAVYDFLSKQSKDQNSYLHSRIWSVVDGPWKLGAYRSDGHYTLVPNKAYSGSPKPRLDSVKFLPFTSDSAEFNVLKSGKTIDIGYIPSPDLPPKPTNSAVPDNNPAGDNYNLMPFYTFSVNYFPENFNNPDLGPVFKQLYFRQAFQMTLNQKIDAEKAFRGYGYPNYGPVPVKPDNKWLSPKAKQGNPYPFDPGKAKQLLESHGWSMQGGTMVCTRPGAGASQCGENVKPGTKLVIDFEYATGNTATTQSMQQLKSDASRAGITLNMKAKPFNSVIGRAVPCKPGQSSCSWQMENWGGGWVYAPDFLPTGEELWQTGAGSNSGSYSDPKMDKLIEKTETTSGTQPLYEYEDYAMQQLPVVWQTNSYAVRAVSKSVGGVVLNPLYTLNPEYWYRTR